MGEGREPAFEREPDPCCPLCTTEAVQHLEYDAERDDWACPNCGLCAPTPVMERVRDMVDRLETRDEYVSTLEAELARLKQPAHVLAEAERLLAEMGVRGDVPAHALLHAYNVADSNNMDADAYAAEEKRRG